MNDFLGRLAARAVGAAPVLRPRTLPFFASTARDFAPAITEELREVEARPAVPVREHGGEPSRTLGRFAAGDHGAPSGSDWGDVLIDGARVVGQAEAERAPDRARSPSGQPAETLPFAPEAASGEGTLEASEPESPVVIRSVRVERSPAAPRRRTPGASRAKAAAAQGRPSSQPAEAVVHGETESEEAPPADDPFSPFSPFSPRSGHAPRGGPAQAPPADESVEVRLSIGRLEIHAPAPPAPAPAPRPRPSRRLSLQNYLGRYQGGRRGE